MSALVAEKLCLRLGASEILAGIDVSCSPGHVTAVIGPNGAGKSSLLMALAGLRTVDSGCVTLDSLDVQAMRARDRAKRIAYLPQLPEIAWAVDVRTFVGLGRTPHLAGFGADQTGAAAVTAALDATQTSALADRDVTTLSGGERARVLIARALAGKPSWLLADEPLTALDPGYQIDVSDLLKRLAQSGRGVVVTLHDLGLVARLADRVIVLAAGKVLADGPVADVLTEDVIARAYGVDAAVTSRDGRMLVDIVRRRI